MLKTQPILVLGTIIAWACGNSKRRPNARNNGRSIGNGDERHGIGRKILANERARFTGAFNLGLSAMDAKAFNTAILDGLQAKQPPEMEICGHPKSENCDCLELNRITPSDVSHKQLENREAFYRHKRLQDLMQGFRERHGEEIR